MRLPDWLPSLRVFIKREWSRAFAGCALGVMAALIGRVLISDAHFRSFLSKGYAPIKDNWDGPGVYTTCIVAFSAALLLAIVSKTVLLATRWARSWREGVITGLLLFPL